MNGTSAFANTRVRCGPRALANTLEWTHS